MKRVPLAFLIASTLLLNIGALQAQTVVIPMTEYHGVYKIPCDVNGLKTTMVFDTGASSVSISSSFAETMMNQGYLTAEDFVGQTTVTTADGKTTKNAVVIFKTLTIGGLVLDNVKGVIFESQQAPLLLGQTAIQKLGSISIKGDKLYITTSSPSNSSNSMYERWDKDTHSYQNYTYGFGWKLPFEIEWERELGEERHTVFRAIGGPFLVFVNAQVAANKNADLWKHFSEMTEALDSLAERTAQITGKTSYKRTYEKCVIFGHHAIKTTFLEHFKDSRFDKARESYAEEYIVIHNGYMLIIAVKANKEVYDKFDYKSLFQEIFQGLTINSSCYNNY